MKALVAFLALFSTASMLVASLAGVSVPVTIVLWFLELTPGSNIFLAAGTWCAATAGYGLAIMAIHQLSE